MNPDLDAHSLAAQGTVEVLVPDSSWPSILMVDDHPARLLTYEAILNGMPVRFVRANSGEEALQLLLKQSFALILLDVNMPGLDGFEVARHVRGMSRLNKVPIIFVSGERLSDLDRLKGYEVGAIDYIGVPIVPEILRSKVAVLIELFNRRAELDQVNAAASGARNPTAAHGVQEGASSRHLRALFDQTPDIKLILRGERDAAGKLRTWRYVDANASALKLYNRTREEIVGRTVEEIFPAHSARATALCQQALLGGQSLQHETEFAHRQLLVRMFAVDEECVAVACTDITERKRVETALANSERRFQALLEGCPVGVAQNAMDGRFEYANNGFCNIVGYTAEELSHLTWQQITHPDDLAADSGRAERVLAGKMPHYTIEKRYIRKDGSPVWVSMFGNFIFDERHKPVQGVAVVVDITARRIADIALQDSRQRLLLAHDAAGLGSFDWNMRSDSATWDNRARELWGLSPDTPVQLSTTFSGIHPDDRRGVRAAIDKASAPDSDGRYQATYRVINVQDGKTRWVESHGQVIFDNGIAVRMVGTKQDITDRVNADIDLRRSEERFRELANNIDQIVWTCDATGQPTWYNDRWYEFSGTTFEEMLDYGWSSLIHPDHVARITAKYRECIGAGKAWEETFPVRSKAGDYRWFLSRATPIRSTDGAVLRWFGSNTDITDYRELQEALTEADKRKDEFLAMLAHELRNPVAPILNVAQILSRQGSRTKDLAGMVSIIDRQARHLARLLDDLLDVARITRNRIELRREVVRTDECIALALETVDPLIRSFQHSLEVERSSDELAINVDKDRLTQCITNLLNNAAKYSPPASRIRVRTYRQDAMAVIEVQDFGRGIRPDIVPRIFELFAQGHDTLDRRNGGLGIGLSVCKRLIEMHGGTVSAHSAGEGQGSTFALKVPLVAIPPRGVSPQPTSQGDEKRVLIVDDNRDAAEAVSMLLELSGHRTQVAFQGEEGLRTWKAFRADVVILDIGLPDLSGYEVVRRLREDGFDGVAIALSGYCQPEDRFRALDSGFDFHFVKPVEGDALEKALEKTRP